MASLLSPVSSPPIFCHIISLFLLLLITISQYPSTVNSQDPSFSSPTISQCTSSLLPLLPCAPFVQGTSVSPGQLCCNNLKQLYTQIPHCLCLLLNDTAMAFFPINRTLALQLPLRCALQINIVSDCPGVKILPTSPATQVSFGTMGNPSVSASPAVPVTPTPSIIGFGHGRRDEISLKARGGFAMAMTIVFVLLI